MTLRDKFKDILNSLELDDDRACGDPECCGDPHYYISHESKAKAITAIFEAFKESLPVAKDTSEPWLNDLDYFRANGWNSYREEVLKNLEE